MCAIVANTLPAPSTTRGHAERDQSQRTRGTMQTDVAIVFALIYFTFFLDNVLLTVLVPMIPEWVSDAPLSLRTQDYHNVTRLNLHTIYDVGDTSQVLVGIVLGVKSLVQLLCAPHAAAAVRRRGAAPALRAATAALSLAALGLWCCRLCDGVSAAVCVGAARVTHGAGAALGGVAGLALAAHTLPDSARHRAISALLGAVALGVLVGYPFGGATYALGSRGAPFLLLGVALLINLAMQHMFLDKDEYNQASRGVTRVGALCALCRLSSRGALFACALCVALTTSVMSALEACLPMWLHRQLHVSRWTTGAVFVPDSIGYFLAASAGGLAQRIGVERVAIAGQVSVGVAALCVTLARSARALAVPHLALGVGLGAADAALVPAIVARHGAAGAALVHVAAAAASALAPPVASLLTAAADFETALRTLAALNIIYAGYLYTRLKQHPLSQQWGASYVLDSDDESRDDEGTEGTPLATLAPPHTRRNTSSVEMD